YVGGFAGHPQNKKLLANEIALLLPSFTPISQLDTQQYSTAALWEQEHQTACKATIYAILAIGVLKDRLQTATAGSITIDDFYVIPTGGSWSGNGTWTNPVANKVFFSDGNGNVVAPTGAGFSIADKQPNFANLLTQGPIMLNGQVN